MAAVVGVIMVEMVSDGGGGDGDGSVEDGGGDGRGGSGLGMMEVVGGWQWGELVEVTVVVLVIVVVMVVGVKVTEAIKLVEVAVAMVTMGTSGGGRSQDRGNDDTVVADDNVQCWHLMSVASNGNIDMVAMALGMKKNRHAEIKLGTKQKIPGLITWLLRLKPLPPFCCCHLTGQGGGRGYLEGYLEKRVTD